MFVYGTLRRDMNYPLLAPHEGVSIGHGRTQGVMYSFGGFPGVVQDGSASQVVGQILSYDHLSSDEWAETILAVDRYEGHGFERREVPIATDNGMVVTAWVYFPVDTTDIQHYCSIIPHGDWKLWRESR
jgi:gamma-glutamylcyclotransferase (GGCT)/AIG2-like uncharacterized protein YtfP